ncbi:MAG: pectate lyase [Planctomycetaceae bacterium]
MLCRYSLVTVASLLSVSLLRPTAAVAAEPLRQQAEEAMKRASEYFVGQVARHGGYVYHYTIDLQTRWGEGLASPDQIWVQPPGTPTVGMAFLDAYNATGDKFYLDAATAAAEALVYGQLKSGGWQNCVDFNPRGQRVSLYRNGRGGGKNASSLDDGQSSSALLFLIRADAALHFKHAAIHEATLIGLSALLAAQYPNGAFPQVWTGPVSPQSVKEANYPDYDWRTEGRVKNYWDMYTLNDNVAGYVARTLREAYQVYQDPKYLDSLRRLGEFLIRAQMPAPQRGWAQQYNYDMQPIWARKFEPPGVSGDETQEAIETLLSIHEMTGDKRFLQPIPEALKYLQASLLPDGQLARYYELKTNRPLYMSRSGDKYSLTYDDSNLPDHYGWKTPSRIDALRAAYQRAQRGQGTVEQPKPAELRTGAKEAIAALDPQGRWISKHTGERLVGQPKIQMSEQYLSSEVFSRNLTTLSQYLQSQK